MGADLVCLIVSSLLLLFSGLSCTVCSARAAGHPLEPPCIGLLSYCAVHVLGNKKRMEKFDWFINVHEAPQYCAQKDASRPGRLLPPRVQPWHQPRQT